VLAAAAQHSNWSRQPLGLSAQARCYSSSSSSEGSQSSAAGGVAAKVAHFCCYCCCLPGAPVAACAAGHCWGRLVQCSAVYVYTCVFVGAPLAVSTAMPTMLTLSNFFTVKRAASYAQRVVVCLSDTATFEFGHVLCEIAALCSKSSSMSFRYCYL
jgi:hypothetical protein